MTGTSSSPALGFIVLRSVFKAERLTDVQMSSFVIVTWEMMRRRWQVDRRAEGGGR